MKANTIIYCSFQLDNATYGKCGLTLLSLFSFIQFIIQLCNFNTVISPMRVKQSKQLENKQPSYLYARSMSFYFQTGVRTNDKTFVPLDDDEPIEMKEPTGVAVDNDGRIFVADRAMGRVEIFDIWGTWSKSIRLTIYPVGIEIDPDIGTLYVADCKNKIIEVYKV